MKLASYLLDGQPAWGLVEGDEMIHVGRVLAATCPDLKTLLALQAIDQVKPAVDAADRSPLTELTWLPVVPNPEKILCVGLNYEMHRREIGPTDAQHPTIFTRFASTQAGHLEALVLPRVSTELDFEGELAVVIGKGGRYIARDRAFDHVAGYSCYNDASVRDWQMHTTQFTPGKNFPVTGGFGPWMVTPDELGDLDELRLSTRLNGEVVQEALLGQMIFDIPAVLAYCSSFTRLEPGDVIVTGTPGGVGMKRTPPLWMKAGDVVEVEIERVGTLRNAVRTETVE